jgi:predicted ABC-type ATPase
VPYRDLETRRTYAREYRRLRRAGDDCSTPVNPQTPVALRLQTSQDVKDLVQGQVAAVLASKADIITKARTVGYLASIQLRAIECGDLAARLEAVEHRLSAGGEEVNP